MNNILIIGAGAMGSAIARGAASAGYTTGVFNRSSPHLDRLSDISGISLYTDLPMALEALEPDIVIMALPLEAIPGTCTVIDKGYSHNGIVASLSPMTTLKQLQELLPRHNVMRIMPNIGITKGESMTFICAENDNAGARNVVELFRTMGDAVFIPERMLGAVTSLASCGIAYALRYVRACMQAGVELGLEADDACRYTLRTIQGACALLAGGSSHPEAEIDKVCTPGGLTIKGVNTLDSEGFTNAVIKAILASYKA